MIGAISKLLRREKPPLALALAIALLSWTLSHTADRLLSQPVVAYSVRTNDIERKQVTVRFENVSRDRLFESLQLVIRIPTADSSRIDSVATRFGANTFSRRRFAVSDSTRRDDASVTLERFHPGWMVTVTLWLTRPSPGLQVVADAPREPVLLLKEGVQIFLVRHEIKVLFGLAALLLLVALMITSVATGSTDAGPPTPGDTPDALATPAPPIAGGARGPSADPSGQPPANPDGG